MSEQMLILLLPLGAFGGYTIRYMLDQAKIDKKPEVDSCRNCFHNIKGICDRMLKTVPDNYYCTGYEVKE